MTEAFHLVLSGSGARFTSFLGCFLYLNDHIYPDFLSKVDTIVATSGGAFVGMLIALGYSLRAIDRLCMSFRYDDFKCFDIHLFLRSFGVDDGSKFIKLFRCIVAKKLTNPDATLADLHAATNRHLIMTGTNISKSSMVTFDHVSHPTMELWRALRISMSVPFLFTSVQWENDWYSDGAILNSFPVSVLNVPSPSDTVIAINLEYAKSEEEIVDVASFASALTRTMLRNINRINYEDLVTRDNYEVFRIRTANISAFNLNVTADFKAQLREDARQQTAQYFENNPRRLVRAIVKRIFQNLLALS